MFKLLFFVMFFGFYLAGAQPQSLEVPEILQEIGINPINYNQTVSKVWLKICRENGIDLQDYRSIKSGDKLLLPDGSYYTILPGEHPWRAAERTAIEWYLALNKKPKPKMNYHFWLPILITLFYFFIFWLQRRPKRKKRAKTLQEALIKNNMPL